MNKPLDTHHAEHADGDLEHVLGLDLNRAGLRRLAEVSARVEADPSLGRRLDDLVALRGILGPEADGEPLGGQAAFARRMSDAVEGHGRPPGLGGWRRLAPGLMGGAIAASLIFAGTVAVDSFQGDGPGASHRPLVGLPDAGHADRLPASPVEQSALLTDLAGFYDNRASWVATTGGDTQVGLSARPLAPATPWVTRLSLMSPGRAALHTDLALFADQDVVVLAPRPDAPPVRYAVRLNPSGDGRSASLTISAQLNAGTAISTSLNVRDDLVQEIGRLTTEHGDYTLHLGLARPAPPEPPSAADAI